MAQLDQDRGDVGRGQDGKAGLPMGVLEQQRDPAQLLDDKAGDGVGFRVGHALRQVDQDRRHDIVLGIHLDPDQGIDPVLSRRQHRRLPVAGHIGKRVDRGAADPSHGIGVGVDRDEQIGVGVARPPDALTQRDVFVVVAGHDHVVAAGLRQSVAKLERDAQGDRFLEQAGRADGAGILAAVAGVDHHHRARRHLRPDRRQQGRRDHRCIGGRQRAEQAVLSQRGGERLGERRVVGRLDVEDKAHRHRLGPVDEEHVADTHGAVEVQDQPRRTAVEAGAVIALDQADAGRLCLCALPVQIGEVEDEPIGCVEQEQREVDLLGQLDDKPGLVGMVAEADVQERRPVNLRRCRKPERQQDASQRRHHPPAHEGRKARHR